MISLWNLLIFLPNCNEILSEFHDFFREINDKMSRLSRLIKTTRKIRKFIYARNFRDLCTNSYFISFFQSYPWSYLAWPQAERGWCLVHHKHLHSPVFARSLEICKARLKRRMGAIGGKLNNDARSLSQRHLHEKRTSARSPGRWDATLRAPQTVKLRIQLTMIYGKWRSDAVSGASECPWHFLSDPAWKFRIFPIDS